MTIESEPDQNVNSLENTDLQERNQSNINEIDQFLSTYSKGFLVGKSKLISENITKKTIDRWRSMNLICPSTCNTAVLLFTSDADKIAARLMEQEKNERSLYSAADLAGIRTKNKYYNEYLNSYQFYIPDRFSEIRKQVIQLTTLNDNLNLTVEQKAGKLGISVSEFKQFLKRAGWMINYGLIHPRTESDFKNTYISMQTLSDMTSLSWHTIAIRLYPYAQEVKLFKSEIELKHAKFPYKIIPQLFVDPIAVRPKDKWVTMSAIAAELGITYIWVLRRVYKMPGIGEYRIKGKKRVLLCFPEDIIDELNKQLLTEYVPGHEYNVGQMSELLHRRDPWINNELKKINAQPLSRRDAVGKVTKFYPEWAYLKIKEVSEKFEWGEDLLTIPKLSEAVGKDREWIIAALAKLHIEGIYRRREVKGRRGMADLCYEPFVIEQLKSLTTDYLPPEPGWHTINGICEELKKEQSWVIKRVKSLNIQPISRLDARGALRLHYPPEVYKTLQMMADESLYTTSKLASTLVKSPPWITQRLKELDIKPVYELKVGKNFYVYYPYEAYLKLQNIINEAASDNSVVYKHPLV